MTRTLLIRSVRSFVLCLLLPPLSALSRPALAQESELNDIAPRGITVAELIRRFAAREEAFKLAREQYTWTQSVKIETLVGSRVDGEYRRVTDVLFDDRGRRIEQVKSAPESTLTRIQITQEDLDDIDQRMPFTMTLDDLSAYDVSYLGQQQEDELHCYVFSLRPKKIVRGQRYFEGRIWVDDHDYQIVKSYGRNVPDVIKRQKGEENLFPRFTTWRKQIDGKYWFPAYTTVDDVLHYSMGDVHIRQLVRYENYRRFGAKSRILYEGQEVTGGGKDQSNGQNADTK